VPLIPTVDREEIHTRHITMRAYRRADGLYDIEGRVEDTKPIPFMAPLAKVEKPAGEHIHDIWVRLVIDDQFRGRGIAKTLITSRLSKLVKYYGSPCQGIFVESNIPNLTENDSFDPTIRLKIFDKLGMKLIPISYIQPPLNPKKDFVSNLYLLYYPISDVQLKTNEVIYFLNSLYLGLNQPIDSIYLKQMRSKLLTFGDNIKLESIPQTFT
jgi:GNAT superfamily N-acetyltransferase